MRLKSACYKHTVIPALAVLATNLFSFYCLRFVNYNRQYHDLAVGFESKIPFIPKFIYIYFLAFIQWGLCYMAIMFEDKQKTLYFTTAASLANLIIGLVFIVFPTMMYTRPVIEGTDFTSNFIRFVFSNDDPPVNLFPSIHCFESWMCVRIIFSSKKLPRWVKYTNAVFSLLVFASTLFVKQHVIVDVPGGILFAELSLLIVRRYNLHLKVGSAEKKLLA